MVSLIKESCCLIKLAGFLSFFFDGSYFFVPVLKYKMHTKSFKLWRLLLFARTLYCYVCMECFQGSFCYSSRTVVVPCRKRVQRYSFFPNYKTFLKEKFEEFFNENSKMQCIKTLTRKIFLQKIELFGIPWKEAAFFDNFFFTNRDKFYE